MYTIISLILSEHSRSMNVMYFVIKIFIDNVVMNSSFCLHTII